MNKFVSFGPTLARKMEQDEQIAQIEAQIEADLVEAICTIAIIRTEVEGVFKIDFAAMDLTPRRAYEAVLVVKQQLEDIYGFDR